MAINPFTKITIVDRNSTTDDIFTITDVDGGKKKLTPDVSGIVQAGTLVNAELLQRYENALQDLCDNAQDKNDLEDDLEDLGFINEIKTINGKNIEGSGNVDIKSGDIKISNDATDTKTVQSEFVRVDEELDDHEERIAILEETPAGGVSDVKVDGTSVVSSGVANISLSTVYATKASLDTEGQARYNGDQVLQSHVNTLYDEVQDVADDLQTEMNTRNSADNSLQTQINNKLEADLCTFQTTAPTSDITDGGVHIVYLTSEPTTKYNGYIYLIKEE